MSIPRKVYLYLGVVPVLGLLAATSVALLVPDPAPRVGPGWLRLSSARGEIPQPGASNQQTAALVLDVDRDGLNDIVIGARQRAPSVVWLRRKTVGWDRYVIDAEKLPIEAGGAVHDVDADGDPDIVMGEDAQGNRLYWWENPYPDLEPDTPWRRHAIKTSGENKHHDQVFGDFDEDGAVELAFWNQGAKTLFLADIPPDPRSNGPWPRRAIFTAGAEPEGLASADIDGDGRPDLIGAGRWFEHVGSGQFRPHLIDPGMTKARVAAGQLIAGGPPEVVFTLGEGEGPLTWYGREDGAWIGHDLLDTTVDHAHTLQIADTDGDGSLDIVAAEMHTPGRGEQAALWIFHGDGSGNFRTELVATGLGNHESRVADLDGDEDLDILVKPYAHGAPGVDVLLNRRADLDRWERIVVDGEKPWRSVFVAAADLDGDGLKDIVTGGWWYRNPGDLHGTWVRRAIGEPLNNMALVRDFNGDGKPDILGTQGKGSDADARFVLARNQGGGSFAVSEEVAAGSGDFLQGAAVVPLGDGAVGLALSWHNGGSGVEMLTVPSDPQAPAWPIRRISQVTQSEALSAGDIDGDGTVDLLLGTKLLLNRGGGWESATVAEAGSPDRNRLADLDGDGALDAIVGFEAISRPGPIVWYRNPNASGGAWSAVTVATVTGPMSLDVGDVDGDGDADIAVGEHNLERPDDARLYVLENADGRGRRWRAHLISRGDEHHDGAILADMDGDSDLDIISIGWSHGRVLLYENRLRTSPSDRPKAVGASARHAM